ncbi:MAG: type II toxin-antitoxin system HicA family toxin [Xanthobacteraceae bacterium]|nr:type II toxin-antitoxin system HicA family toxin [Xanthobacteraceae bacterium]
MKLPRELSGRDLARGLCARWGYRQVNQVGSHIILQTDTPQHHRLSVPDHKPLRIGTLNAILRQVAAAKGVTRADILASLS